MSAAREAGLRHRLGERAPLPARLRDAARRLQGVGLRQGHVALLDGGIHAHQARRGEAVLTVEVSATMSSATSRPVQARGAGRARARALHRVESALARALRAWPRHAARRRPDELDGEVGGGLPAVPPRGDGRPRRRRGRARVRRLLPWRHGRDGRPRAAGDRRRGRRAGGPGRHRDAAERGRDRRGRRADAPLRLRGWQFTLSATDANRFAIRLAREITQRPKILVFDYCYHGTVDETFATLDGDRVVARSGNVGPPVDVR